MASNNNTEFWRLQDGEDSYWDDYIATRPVYDQRFMDRIFQFHIEHMSTFETAVDIGCGAGSGTEALLSQFQHVIASDNDPVSLRVVSRKLVHMPKDRLAFVLSAAEAIDQHCSPGSIDLVASAESFPILNTQKSLDAFHQILRPEGTLAIWFYGPINFTEPDFRPHCQLILDMILDLAFKRVVSGCGPDRQQAWKHTTEAMFSWLDYIPFAPLKWKDVRRHKWNPHMNLPFFGPNACDFRIAIHSNVMEQEVNTSATDPCFWRVDLNIVGVRRFVAAAFPWPAGLRNPTSEMEKLFSELETAMGGSNAQRAFSWPVSLILASKRR